MTVRRRASFHMREALLGLLFERGRLTYTAAARLLYGFDGPSEVHALRQVVSRAKKDGRPFTMTQGAPGTPALIGPPVSSEGG